MSAIAYMSPIAYMYAIGDIDAKVFSSGSVSWSTMT
jgi:hypothetical protein